MSKFDFQKHIHMSYHFNKILKNITFETAVESVKSELKKEGFGVITEIDMKATLKQKLDVDFKKYIILGACNPEFAYKVLQQEDLIGLFLPCNVIVVQQESGEIEVAAVDPIASMQAVENNHLGSLAGEIRERMMRVIECL